MIATEDLWPALLAAREHLALTPAGQGDCPSWRFTRRTAGPWRFAAIETRHPWGLGDDVLDCDLATPMPQAVAARVGFAARYLELLCRQWARSAQHPYTTACFAQSLDGFIATADGDSQWIGNEHNLVHAHRLRALHDGILVGCRTLLRDRPRLTVRRVPGKHPRRIVLTRQEQLSREFLAAIEGPTVVLKPAARSDAGKAEGERPTHGEGMHRNGTLQIATVETTLEDGYLCPHGILDALRRLDVHSLMIEGGGVTASLFQRHGLLDQADIQIAPMFLGEGVRPILVDARASIAGAPVYDARVDSLGHQSLMTLLFS